MYGPNKIIGGKYRLIASLGAGGFGSVYRAVEIGQEAQGEIALKLLLRTPQLKTRDLVRFQREAVLMSQLLHPGVVAVHALGEWEGIFFIAMELVSGPHLEDYARKGLSLEESLSITLQVAEILDYVHQHRIVHRDIKPQNILLCEPSEKSSSKRLVKLVDFGVARMGYAHLADVGLNLQDEVVGTYGYMAPEATGHRPEWLVDGRSDIYSLGAVLFELLMGQTPFGKLSNETKGRIQCEQHAPALKGGPWPKGLASCLATALAQNPADRYQSVAGFLWDLKKILQGQGLSTPSALRPSLGHRLTQVFVGRDAQLDQMNALVSRGQSRTRMMWSVVDGTVGLGKTAFLHRLRQKLEESATRFLFLRFSASVTHMPYQALTLAVNDYFCEFERYNKAGYEDFLSNCVLKLGESAALLAPYFPDIRQEVNKQKTDGPLLPPNGVSRGSLQQAFIDLFVSLGRKDIVGRNTAEEPLVFLLDDAHAADGETLTLFQHLTEQVNDAANFHFVLSLDGSQSPEALTQFLDRVSRLKRRFHKVELQPLTTKDLETWAQSVPVACTTNDVDELHRKSQGVPKVLERVLLCLEKEGALTFDGQGWRLSGIDHTVFGVAVEELLARLQVMPLDHLETLWWAALGQGLPAPWMEKALEGRLPSAQDLQRQGYLKANWTLTHERLRSRVLALVPPGWMEKAHAHFALLAPLEPGWWDTLPEGPWVQWARHAEGAGSQLKPEVAASILLAGGRQALDKEDGSKAFYYFEKVQTRLDLFETPVKAAFHRFGFALALHLGHQHRAWGQGKALVKLGARAPEGMPAIAWGLGYNDRGLAGVLLGIGPGQRRWLAVLGWGYINAAKAGLVGLAGLFQWLARRSAVPPHVGEWAGVLAHEGQGGMGLWGVAMAAHGPPSAIKGSLVGVLLAAVWLRFGHIRTAYKKLSQSLPEKLTQRPQDLKAYVWAARYLDEPAGRFERVVATLSRQRFSLLAKEPGGTVPWRGLAAWTSFLTAHRLPASVWAWEHDDLHAPVHTDREALRLCQMLIALFDDHFHQGAHTLWSLEGLRPATAMGQALRWGSEGVGALARGNDQRVVRRLTTLAKGAWATRGPKASADPKTSKGSNAPKGPLQGPPYGADALRLTVALLVLSQRVLAPGTPGSRKGALAPVLKALGGAKGPLMVPKGARRTPSQWLFLGVCELFTGKSREALVLLNGALKEARAQKALVVEALSGLYLAMALGGRQSARALECLEVALTLANTHRWPWVQRLCVEATGAFGLPSVAQKNGGAMGRTLGASVAVRSWIQHVQAVPAASRSAVRTTLLQGAMKAACDAVQAPCGALFVLASGNRFPVQETWGPFDGSLAPQIGKFLSKSAETPIKLLSLDLENGLWVAGAPAPMSQVPTQPLDTSLPTQTQPLDLATSHTATGGGGKPPPGPGYWLLVAVPLEEGTLGGWIALAWTPTRLAPSPDEEAELQLLASHVGSLLPMAAGLMARGEGALDVPPWLGPVPGGVWWQSKGPCQRHQGEVGWQGMSFGSDSLMVGAWTLPGAPGKGLEWLGQSATLVRAWSGGWGPLAQRVAQDILESLCKTAAVTAVGELRWDLLLVHLSQRMCWRITVGQELFVEVGALDYKDTEVVQEVAGAGTQRLVCRTTPFALGDGAVWILSPLFWDAPFLRSWTQLGDAQQLAMALRQPGATFEDVVTKLNVPIPQAWGQGGCALGVWEAYGVGLG